MLRLPYLSPLILGLCLTVLAAFLVPTESAISQVPGGIHEDELKMRAYMVEISEQLGVTCTHCHNVKNLKSDEKRAFKVAKDHMRITNLLHKEGFKGQLKVDCRMCHKGQVKPPYLDPKKEN